MSTDFDQKPRSSSTSQLRYSFGSGYWLSPNDYVYRVEPRHIVAVCDYPERFGLDEEQLQKVFLQAGEPLRVEGEARRAIILRLVTDGGWIRVRQYRWGWTFNVPNLSACTIARVRGFFLAFEPSTVPNANVTLDSPDARVRTCVADLIDATGNTLSHEQFAHEVIVPTPVSSPAEIPLDGVPRVNLL